MNELEIKNSIYVSMVQQPSMPTKKLYGNFNERKHLNVLSFYTYIEGTHKYTYALS